MKALFRSLILLLSLMAGQAAAHALDPGYLQIQSLDAANGGETYQIFWRKPDVKGKPMPIEARLPENCAPAMAPVDPRFDGRAWVQGWVASCPGGFGGRDLVIEGLESTRTDVLIRLDSGEASVTTRVTAARPSMVAPAVMSGRQVFTSYLGLGFEHILEGLDHLLFVFALLVLIRDPWRLAGAITAFTVAHSITLALATLGVLQVPSPPVEAIIALSIVLLAVEILRRRKGAEQLTEQYPWIISFSFGLLHGLGFAGALSEIGLPEGDIPLALLAFNLGVEAGQLTFVAVVLLAFAVLRAVLPRFANALHAPEAVGSLVMGYAIGGISVYWLAERVAGF
ncbi:HupE/UreJ family protein [Primorskyibacter sp. S87]|uniref:HupE/UreJ family protein n=1 Tax=Primorskyibacter sp. S87 TaxID=3415126 RepID=UPI003C7CFC65